MSKVEFIQSHEPPVESGVYRLHLEQRIAPAKSTDTRIPTRTYAQSMVFSVTGERFDWLDPQSLVAVFPADGSQGDHANVLPHMTFTRSTLPWERSPDDTASGLAWLTLLLFRDTDDEVPALQTMTVGDLLDVSKRPENVKFPSITLEPTQRATDKVCVIDVKASALKKLIPTKSEVSLLAHVRLQQQGDGIEGGPVATTIFCNRLPQSGGMSTVYCVSVEQRYPDENFDFQGAGDDDYIRLVCLQSFSFSCISGNFSEFLEELDSGPLTLKDLANDPQNPAQSLLQSGFVPLRHRMRGGDRTVSWYHGPCGTGADPDEIRLPVQSGDQLVRYDTTTSLFDVSYAAAWQLGRMLTLKNQGVSLSLYDWKRNQAQAIKQGKQRVPHLPLKPQAINTDTPRPVAAWFRDLSLLRYIPFSYLVPDARLLPIESIRFFTVDALWMDCLLDGAFSIGRVTDGDWKVDAKTPQKHPFRKMSGFFMRSQVVSGWPGLLVEGYSEVIDDEDAVPAADKALPLLRMERLSENTLLCLFAGELGTVDIHQKPETLHYGLEEPTGTPLAFHKQVRDLTTGDVLDTIDIPWQDEDLGVVSVTQFNAALAKVANANQETPTTFTSAQFGMEMMEGVQKVRFARKA
ncbi:hypothetical protein [Chondromyces crocatus]|uniref:Uncharacterized protein n=1 Tax=Chondromyces crocatus TaxID=52 RepID=A0A0K1EFZ9_CHOCO|nr:hypothetical protein [Chondromyces crocatus]AKT39602.1 uncharacterized protein CMC5_037510 [Chondromyces crocatus]